MAPLKPKVVHSKTSRGQSSSPRKKSNKSTGPPPKQQKTKRTTSLSQSSETKKKKKKKHTYTADQLGVPALNGIVPAGISKPKGKKKGKVFVDDPERMVMILSIVNSEAEGKVESKMMRQRQLEEVREARRLEAEKREMEKKGTLEDVKEAIRQKRKRKTRKAEHVVDEEVSGTGKISKKNRKSVTFAS